MSVIIESVDKGSPAYKAGLKSGYTLLTINGNEIMDVLDYRFYQNNEKLVLSFINEKGKIKNKRIKKAEESELGLNFATYLMDKQRSCLNKCIFCFIDQLPKGMRESLYFKDDDSRLSFLFGNYITLTNITEHEIDRIIKMHISPINISVHTTNPELRVKMMKNKNAGKVLSIIKRFNDAGIKLNCQLVLVPDVNDGDELCRSLSDLLALSNVESVAAVPVGLTKHRQGLAELKGFDKQNAAKTIDIIERFGDETLQKYGNRRCYASDEFYILAERQMPNADYYGDFLQLENGVGLCSLLLSEADDAINLCDCKLEQKRKITLVTGVDAYPFITQIVDKALKKWDNLECSVKAIKNDYFGHSITVAGLVTATDIEKQLKGQDLGEELLIPKVMLRSEQDMFLDSITVEELSRNLGVKITPVEVDGFELIDHILGVKE
jgi:putative radical SAM enzyme (TIGR03279 family)